MLRKVFSMLLLISVVIPSCKKSDILNNPPAKVFKVFNFEKNLLNRGPVNPLAVAIDITVEAVSTTVNNVVETAATFYTQQNLPVTITMKVSNLEANISTLQVFDEYNQLITTITTNRQTQAVTTQKAPTPAKKSIGQATADCINDLYANHGWTSVSMWIMTALVPETMIPVVAHCISYQLAH